MEVDKKQAAKEYGKLAEELTSQEYLKRGYTIVERNWRLGKKEIDLVVRKDQIVVIVEVKARKEGEEEAVEAVNSAKRKRMIQAADFYLKQLPGWNEYRFDIAAFTGDKNRYKLEIIEYAFVAADLM